MIDARSPRSAPASKACSRPSAASAAAMKAAARRCWPRPTTASQRDRGRGARLERRLGQRRDRRDGRRASSPLRSRRSAASSLQANEIVRGATEDATATNDDIAALAQRRAEDRRRGEAHSGHRRPDQSPGAQRHHRGGARRRGRARFCRGSLGGEVAGGADREGDRRDHPGDPLGAGLDRRRGHRDPHHHARGCRRSTRHTSEVAGAVEQQDAATGEISQNVASAAAGTRAVVAALGEVATGVTQTRSSAATVLAASEEVEKATARLRSEVEDFLRTVAALAFRFSARFPRKRVLQVGFPPSRDVSGYLSPHRPAA